MSFDRPLIWLIESGVYGPDAEPLRAEIRRQGMPVESVPHRALVKGPAPIVNGKPLAPGDHVIGYGTFPYARQIQLHSGWVPGAWCDPVQLDCSNYYPVLGRFLLNREYEILPGAEAVRQQDRLFGLFGREGKVFSRPTECGKTFVGRCIDQESFTSALGPVRHDPAAQVIIATPIQVDREWRLLIRRNEIVTGTQYARSGSREVARGYPDDVRGFAEELLQTIRWRPDPIFFLDVAEVDGRLGVVEVSGFSCSWLYGCDLRAVVEAVKLAAV